MPAPDQSAGETSASRSVPSVGRLEVVLCGLVCAALSVVLAISFGRDLNWDFFNYHLYSGLLLAQGRVGQDFFAAGYQGYMNPLPYLPLYLMVAAKWHSIAVASVIAVVQSLNFCFLYLLSRRVVGEGQKARTIAILITALGACSSVVLGQLGSSFIDFSTAWPVMAALWLLLGSPAPSRILIAGVLVGLAVGLKLTNVVFAFGAFAVVALQPIAGMRSRIRQLLLLTVGLVLGALATYGYWAVALYQTFGSPVFPMFNQLFRAPDFAPVAIQYARFLPNSFWDLVMLPLRLVELRSWIYVETAAPDLRPLAVILAATAMLLRAFWMRFSAATVDPNPTARSGEPGVLRLLSTFVIASLIAWLPTSANGRYAAPILLLLGPLLYLCLIRLLSVKKAMLACATVLALQITHLISAGNPHWSPTPWATEWLPAQVPQALRQSPHLFLTVGASSESYVAAFVHPDSVFSNPIGMISIATGGPGWTRLQTLISSHKDRVQVLFPAWSEDFPVAEQRSYFERRNALVDRLELSLDRNSCQILVFNGSGPSGPGDSMKPRRLLSCAAERLLHTDRALAASRAQAERVMNLIEDRCPGVFAPNRAQVEGNGAVWVRMYGKNDIFLVLNASTAEVTFHMEHQNVDTVIGNVASIEADIQRLKCTLPRDGARGM